MQGHLSSQGHGSRLLRMTPSWPMLGSSIIIYQLYHGWPWPLALLLLWIVERSWLLWRVYEKRWRWAKALVRHHVVTWFALLSMSCYLSWCIEEGVNHLVKLLVSGLSRSHKLTRWQWTFSALQLHPWALVVVDEDATSGNSFIPASPISIWFLGHVARAARQDRQILQVYWASARWSRRSSGETQEVERRRYTASKQHRINLHTIIWVAGYAGGHGFRLTLNRS